MISITEALAEIKTIGKRIEKKREFTLTAGYLWRQEKLKDPLERDSGSRSVIARERQAIADLEIRIIVIRQAIAKANAETSVTIMGLTNTVAEWLTWKREVAPKRQAYLSQLRTQIQALRQQANRQGVAVTTGEPQTPDDIIVNVDEREVAKDIEALEQLLGTLDGQLSLKNATTLIDV